MAVLSQNTLVEQLDGIGDATARQLRALCIALLTMLDCESPLFIAIDPRLAEVLRLIAMHPHEHYSVEDLARYVQLERSHFSRLFRAQLHVSAQTYLMHARLANAARALLGGNSVTQCAVIAGYKDSKAFSRAFSAQFGISPARYRKYHILQP